MGRYRSVSLVLGRASGSDRAGPGCGTGAQRPPQIHILVQFAALTADPLSAVSGWAGKDDPTPQRHLDSPFILVGDEDQITAHLGRLERLGVASITVFEHSADVVTRILAQQKK